MKIKKVAKVKLLTKYNTYKDIINLMLPFRESQLIWPHNAHFWDFINTPPKKEYIQIRRLTDVANGLFFFHTDSFAN